MYVYIRNKDACVKILTMITIDDGSRLKARITKERDEEQICEEIGPFP